MFLYNNGQFLGYRIVHLVPIFKVMVRVRGSGMYNGEIVSDENSDEL